MAITEDAVAFYESLNLYERVGLGLVLVILTYITVGSFQPSGKRRQEARSRHVLASNVVIMFSIFISVPVLYAIAMIGGCSAAIAAFVGVLVYLAIGLLTGGAFLGIAVWGVGVLSVLYISDSTMTLGRITGLYTLFTVAIVLAYPAFALVFPDYIVHAVAGFALSSVLTHADPTIPPLQGWLVAAIIFILLQAVAHPTYRDNDTSLLALVVMAGLTVAAHANALAYPEDHLAALFAFTSAALSVATLAHNMKAAVFTRYDPHETRAQVISVTAFIIAAWMIHNGGAADGDDAATAAHTNGLIYMLSGYGLASVLGALAFGVAARWVPEDSIAWRLVIIDTLMLIPFFVVPLVLVAVHTGAYHWPLCAAKWAGLEATTIVKYMTQQGNLRRAFYSLVVLRVLGGLCNRAVASHSMTFLPLLALTVDRGSARTKLLGLTFNGGPDPDTTPALLSVLREYEASATFFITAERAAAYPKLVRDIYDDDHEIGILGTACVDVLGQTAAAEASKAARIIEYITGERPTLYRPPISGDRSPVAMQGVASLGFTITMWSVCPWEWQGTEAQVYERVPSLLDAAGYLVLLHEVVPPTISGGLIAHTNVKCVDTTALLLRDLAGKGMESVSASQVIVPSPETLP